LSWDSGGDTLAGTRLKGDAYQKKKISVTVTPCGEPLRNRERKLRGKTAIVGTRRRTAFQRKKRVRERTPKEPKNPLHF